MIPTLASVIGSSPRARGRGSCDPHLGRARRFIPACAGNRTSRRPAISAHAVHPRVRGEQVAVEVVVQVHLRFIPACAGNRFVHAFSVSGLFGSSPRARGTGTGVCRRAGPSTVHPRVRGEQAVSMIAAPAVVGSSPRARGTGRMLLGTPVDFRGSSPRARGTGPNSTSTAPTRTVHPRVRGEQVVPPIQGRPALGSSPRARGTGDRRHCGRRQRRFIPACAGNRSLSTNGPSVMAVHPRVRGEQS